MKDYRLIESYGALTEEQKQKCFDDNRHTFECQGGGWLAAAKENFTEASGGKKLTDLYDYFITGPALIIGAGPSLKRNLENVAKWPGYKVVVDRAYDALFEAGIVPDLVVCQDGSTAIKYFLTNIQAGTKAAISVTTHPTLWKHLKERGADVYWYGPINPFNPLTEALYGMFGDGIGLVMEGGTGGFSATDIAVKLGFKTVCTIGIDLCYSDMPGVLEGGNQNWGVIELADGKYTTPNFEQSALAMDALPALYPEVRFIDFSHGLISTYEHRNIADSL